MNKRQSFALVATVLLGALSAVSQGAVAQATAPAPAVAPVAATAAPAAIVPSGPKGPARAFRGVELGMDRESAIAALKKDIIFAYRGPEDLSLLPSPNQSLIEVAGLSFVHRGYFQFYEGKLWVMILVLDADKVDHYSIYTSLVAKYGEPSQLDPKESRWEDKSTRMALERPLTLRFMDMDTYAKLREGANAKESVQELDRQGFLGGL